VTSGNQDRGGAARSAKWRVRVPWRWLALACLVGASVVGFGLYREAGSKRRLSAVESLERVNREGGLPFLERELGSPTVRIAELVGTLSPETWGFDRQELMRLLGRWGPGVPVEVVQWRWNALLAPPYEVNALVRGQTGTVWLLAAYRSDFGPPTCQGAGPEASP